MRKRRVTGSNVSARLSANGPASVRLCRGRLWVRADAAAGVRRRESGSGVPLRFHRRQTGPGKFLCLQVILRARDGGLSGVEIRRRRRGRTRRPSGGDGLPGIAHFLHGSPGASGEPCNTDK
jgi:hypothetical protein